MLKNAQQVILVWKLAGQLGGQSVKQNKGLYLALTEQYHTSHISTALHCSYIHVPWSGSRRRQPVTMVRSL